MFSELARVFVTRSQTDVRGGLVRRSAAMCGICVASAFVALPCSAQTSVNSSTQQLPSGTGSGSGSATSMWGVGSGSGNSSSSNLDSATMHDTLGQSAALVNSAKRGFLYSEGTSIVFEAIGSQSIVNTSIYGDNNIANVSANQTATNNGNVNANGSISLTGNATTTIGGSPSSGTTAPNSTTPSGATAASGSTTPSGSKPNGTNVQTGTTTLNSSTVGSSPNSGNNAGACAAGGTCANSTGPGGG